MKVTPISKTTSTFVKDNFLRIPRFQRPYDWESENLTDFWNDLCANDNSDYFMGSVVLYQDTKEANVVYIVDGQQRLTTTIIMLSLIRDQFDELNEDNLSVGVQNFLLTKDADNKDRFVLEHTPPNAFFQNAIMLTGGDKDKKPESQEEVNIANAKKILGRNLSRRIAKYGDKAEKISALKSLRDRLLSHQYISIELDNEDDAYIIFETLNTRGKDLRISDLVKNHLAKMIKGKAKSDDPVRERWGGVIRSFDSVKTSYSPDDFILHYWLAKESFVSRSKLFKEFKAKITKKVALDRLKDIEKYAATYITVVAPSEVEWSKEELVLRDSLAAVGVFRVAQALPLMLAIMQLYRDKTIKLNQTVKAIKLVENFTFQFNAITQSRGGGGISAMYAKLAQDVSKVTDSNKFSDEIAKMKSKFGDRIPPAAEFDYPFATTIYRSDFPRYRELVRYMLGKLSVEAGMGSQYSKEAMTIEHLESQSGGKRNREPGDVGAIGNLFFVTEEMNGKLSAKSFAAKKKLLAKVPWVWPEIETKAGWGSTEIADRGLAMAELGREKIWKI